MRSVTQHRNNIATTSPQHRHNIATTSPQHHHNIAATTSPQHRNNITTTSPQHRHNITTTSKHVMHVPSTFIILTTLQTREIQPVIILNHFIIINKTIHPFYELFTFSHTTFYM
jgi:hypothetical protein